MNIEPIQSTKAEADDASMLFATTLRELMIEKRISASDLARQMWGTTKDKRGYEVARNRDRIGHYLSGKSYPTKINIEKMAKALKVKVEVLQKIQPIPVVRSTSAPKDIQVLYFVDGPNKGAASLTMTKIALSLKTITEVMSMIEKDPVHSNKSQDKKLRK